MRVNERKTVQLAGAAGAVSAELADLGACNDVFREMSGNQGTTQNIDRRDCIV